MKRKQFRTRPWLVAAFALLLCMMAGFAVGKYIQTVSISGKVTFSAKLAESMILQEHEAVRQPDGSYVLSKTATVSENETQEYILIPGLDVQKDPCVIITGKTPLEAYLFLEVVETGDISTSGKPITYEISSDWKKLDNVTAKNDGTVYVYTGGEENPAVLDENITKNEQTAYIYILKNNTITVSQELVNQSTDGNDLLTFYACMGETALGVDAVAVYNNIT